MPTQAVPAWIDLRLLHTGADHLGDGECPLGLKPLQVLERLPDLHQPLIGHDTVVRTRTSEMSDQSTQARSQKGRNS